MPKVSVIIPTYNRAEYLKQAIESVLAQTYRDFELIISDDGSTDHTPEVIKSYLSRLRYVRFENAGTAVNMIRAVGVCEGEYFAMLGDDDLWLPNFLQRQVEVLDRDEKLAFVCSSTFFIDAKGSIIKSVERGKDKPKTFFSLLEENYIQHLATLVRRKYFDAVGGFDKDLETTQDYDLWLRLSKRYPFAYTDEVLTKYRVHGGNISLKLDQHLEDHLRILEKKEITSGLNAFQLQIYRARMYYIFGGFYLNAGQYGRSALCYLKAVVWFPAIGILYWPPETEKFRFSFPYRFLKPYWLCLALFIKNLLPKQK